MQTHWQFNQHSTTDDVVKGHQLRGKTVIVTGANTGLGYETARSLASAGAKVILACRNASSGNNAVARIQQQHPAANAEYQQLDLASLASVRRFCAQLEAATIDLLICNAGSMSTTLVSTEQGYERTVGICHIGHFLLAQLLMPQLLLANSPRVVMLSSEAHRYPKTLHFDTLLDPGNHYATMKAYGQAKLCNALMALELQHRYGEQGLTACSVHPGNMVSTDFGRESRLARIAFKLVSPFTKTPNQGAATTVYCALHQPASEIAGGYFSHCQPASPTAEANNPAVAKKLWELTTQWVTE